MSIIAADLKKENEGQRGRGLVRNERRTHRNCGARKGAVGEEKVQKKGPRRVGAPLMEHGKNRSDCAKGMGASVN